MAGRETRRQLLSPSFLIVTTAIACGGTTQRDEPLVATNPPTVGDGAGAPGAGGSVANVGTGGGGAAGGPAVAGTATVGGTGTIGVGGNAGTNGRGGSFNPPVLVLPCPVALPVDDSSCATGSFIQRYPPMCVYETEDCAGALAFCDSAVLAGTWQVEACDGGASGAGGAGGAAGAD